jgi:hypothetical protein
MHGIQWMETDDRSWPKPNTPVQVCPLLRNICFSLNKLLQFIQKRATVHLSSLCLQADGQTQQGTVSM